MTATTTTTTTPEKQAHNHNSHNHSNNGGSDGERSSFDLKPWHLGNAFGVNAPLVVIHDPDGRPVDNAHGQASLSYPLMPRSALTTFPGIIKPRALERSRSSLLQLFPSPPLKTRRNEVGSGVGSGDKKHSIPSEGSRCDLKAAQSIRRICRAAFHRPHAAVHPLDRQVPGPRYQANKVPLPLLKHHGHQQQQQPQQQQQQQPQPQQNQQRYRYKSFKKQGRRHKVYPLDDSTTAHRDHTTVPTKNTQGVAKRLLHLHQQQQQLQLPQQLQLQQLQHYNTKSNNNNNNNDDDNDENGNMPIIVIVTTDELKYPAR
ncbi:hypothetical protein BGZ65_010157, partial [Modicella reniformis]